jgi:hypothetical protein
MTGLTDFITEANWEDILTIWLVLVDDAYQALQAQFGPIRRRGPQPEFSDSEVITVGLLIDTFFHGHEALGLSFVRQYHPDLFPALVPEGQFNTRRRYLRMVTEQIRQYLTRTWGLIDAQDNCRLIDSAPIPICTYARASGCRTVSGSEHFSVMKSRGAKLLGMRLYLTVSNAQVVDQGMLAPAGPRDSKVMAAFLEDAHDMIFFGDGAFHDPAEMNYLSYNHNIKVFAPPRKDAKGNPWPKKFRKWAGRLRRKIETTLSVLVTAFNVEKPGSRSFYGLITRVASRLLAYNLCFITGPLLAQLRP